MPRLQLLWVLCIAGLLSVGCKGKGTTEGSCTAEELDMLQETCLSHGGDFEGASSSSSLEECGTAVGWTEISGSCRLDGEGSCSVVCSFPSEADSGDNDGDGFSPEEGDCDDEDPEINPAAIEVCNGVDDNCNNFTDDADPSLDLSTTTAWYPDNDGDAFGQVEPAAYRCAGLQDEASLSGDCDDGNPAINPGADEYCDGLDTNCNDIADDEAVDAPPWFPDADGDGYGDPSLMVAECHRPPGTYLDNGEDCDDSDASISPAAVERCNGWDDDCDGDIDEIGASDGSVVYADLDGDGHGDPGAATLACGPTDGYEALGDDCDDADADVHPEQTERAADGLDNDCNGEIDTIDMGDAGAKVIGDATTSSDYYLGYSWSSSVDVDGDGDDDLALGSYYGSYGRIDLVDGSISGSVSVATATASLIGSAAGVGVGSKAFSDGADADGDGFEDVAVGSTLFDHSEIYLQFGPFSGVESLSEDYAALLFEEFGLSASLADVDGDTLADVVVGAWADCLPGGTRPGGVFVFASPPSQNSSLADAEWQWCGPHDNGVAGNAVEPLDYNGDGISDLVIGAYEDGFAGSHAGAVYLVPGGVPQGNYSLADADDVYYSEAATGGGANANLGRSVANGGDTNGDGLDDAVVGSPGDSEGGGSAGAAWILDGSVSGPSLAGLPKWIGVIADQAGIVVSGVGNIDGATGSEMLVGNADGKTWLVANPGSSTSLLEDAALFVSGGTGGGAFGVGDLDSDGLGDFLVTDYSDSEGGAQAGAVFLFFGADIAP
jgi:hypothetical protein